MFENHHGKCCWAAKKTHQKLKGKKKVIYLFTESYCSHIMFLSPLSGHNKPWKLPWSGQKFLTHLLQNPLPPVHHPNNPLSKRSRCKPSTASQSSSHTLLSYPLDREKLFLIIQCWRWCPIWLLASLKVCVALWIQLPRVACWMKNMHTFSTSRLAAVSWQTWSWQTCSESYADWAVVRNGHC